METVIIIGGGPAGTTLAKNLDSSFNVLLIDRKQYNFHNIGALRAAVQADFYKNIALPYTQLLKNGHVLNAEVESVSKKEVRIVGREEPLKFDHLVLATGSSYAFPLNVAPSRFDKLESVYADFNKAIEQADNIVIGGGGPVGFELAGEIRNAYPDKQLTIVSPVIFPNPRELPQKFRDAGTAILNDNEVELIQDKVIPPKNLEGRYLSGNLKLKLDSGKKIQADLLIMANGSLINQACYEEAFKKQLTDEGRLRVDERLRVEKTKNVYAIGDCSSIEARLAFNATKQAKYLSKALIAQAKGKTPKPYKASNEPIMFAYWGDKSGIGVKGTTMFPKFMVGKLKAGNVFVDKFAKDNGLSLVHNKKTKTWTPAEEFAEPDDNRAKQLAKLLGSDKADAQALLTGGYKIPGHRNDLHV